MTCTHDGRRVFIGCNDGSIRVWDLAQEKEIAKWEDHKKCVLSLDLSPDEKQLVSGGDDGVVRVWDVATGRVIARGEGHQGGANCVSFAPSGAWVASTGNDGGVRAWDAKTGNKLRDLPKPSDRGTSLAISPDERWILSGGDDDKLHVWNVHLAREEQSIATGHRSQKREQYSYNLNSIQFLPGAAKFITHGIDGDVQVWDFDKRTALNRFSGVKSWAFGLSSDGARIAYFSDNRMIVKSLAP